MLIAVFKTESDYEEISKDKRLPSSDLISLKYRRIAKLI
jgi:hypothetical protein